MNLTVGRSYTVTRRTGEVVRGKLTEVVEKATGAFYAMQIGDRKNPKIVQVRAAQLSK